MFNSLMTIKHNVELDVMHSLLLLVRSELSSLAGRSYSAGFNLGSMVEKVALYALLFIVCAGGPVLAHSMQRVLAALTAAAAARAGGACCCDAAALWALLSLLLSVYRAVMGQRQVSTLVGFK
jgi:hypothetical protein